jgi:hypothetical protein
VSPRAILRDESIYKNTAEFQPDRFITQKNPEVLSRMEPRNYIFGFGRRRCPGADLVESSIWLLLVTMCATLDISKPVENGKVIEPIAVYGENSKFRSVLDFLLAFDRSFTTANRLPTAFKCDIRFRSSQAASLVE